MIATPSGIPSEGRPSPMGGRPSSHEPTAIGARAILDMAAEVEAAEIAIKRAVLDAAKARDAARVVEIVTRWMNMPAAEVLADSP